MKDLYELRVESDIIREDIHHILESEIDWNLFAGKTVLITGAAGMLASYITEALLKVGRVHSQPETHVIALVRNKGKAAQRFSQYEKSSSLQLIEQDVCDELLLEESVHIIIHAASLPRPDSKKPMSALMPNVQGTLRLLEYAKASGTVEQFIFISSAEVYGVPPPEISTLDEDTFYPISPTDARSCYAEGKRVGEALCVAFTYQYGIPTKIVRLFHSYGPGMDIENDPRFFSSCVANIVNNQNIVLTGDGTAERCYCYMSDAVSAIFYITARGEAGIPYNVGNDEMLFSTHELACRLVANFPEKKLKVIGGNLDSQNGYFPGRNSKIRPDLKRIRTLGWKPNVNVDQGFKRTVDCYRRIEDVT